MSDGFSYLILGAGKRAKSKGVRLQGSEFMVR